MGLGLVSFVIPSYNYGRFVGEAVDSCLAQTYSAIEVIVMDDGSTDDTRERLAAYGDRIRYIHQQNCGMSGARNAGIRAARGDIVCLLDADDVVHPQLVEALGKVMVRERLHAVCPGIAKDPSDFAQPIPDDARVRIIEVEDLLSSSPLTSSGMMMRKASALEAGAFDEKLRFAEDRDLWLRLASRHRIGVVACKGFYYRLHPAQTNRKTQGMLTANQSVLDRFFAEHPGYDSLAPLAYAYMHFGACINFLEEGSRGLARHHLLTSLRYYPFATSARGRLSSLTRLKLLTRLLVGERVFRVLARTRT